MANWATFGSDSDLHRCGTSDENKLSYHSKYTHDGLSPHTSCGGGNLAKKNLTEINREFDPLSRNHLDEECCMSLPEHNPITRSSALSSSKCSSSCENLGARCKTGLFDGHSDIPPPLHPKLCKSSSDNPLYGTDAPPIPPRDYAPGSTHRTRPRQAEIHPIVRNGRQLTHTHYWLLPDKLPQKPAVAEEGHGPEMYINVIPPTPRCPAASAARSAPTEGGNFDCSMSSSRLGALKKTPAFGSLTGSDSIHLLSDEADIDTASVDLNFSESGSHCNTVTNKSHRNFEPGFDSLDGHESISMKDVKDLIETVQSLIEGVSADESYTALSTNSWKVDPAVKYLKVEHLFRLGIASRPKCQSLLQRHGWNIEHAASAMLDLSTNSQKPFSNHGACSSTIKDKSIDSDVLTRTNSAASTISTHKSTEAPLGSSSIATTTAPSQNSSTTPPSFDPKSGKL